MKVSWQATVVAVALMAFVLGVLWLGLAYGATFSQTWAALGTVVGVLTGAIPSFFFKRQADTATAGAARDAARLQVYAEHLDPGAIPAVREGLRARNLLS